MSTTIKLELTRAQLIEIRAALEVHVIQLKEDFAFVASKANQQCLLAANNALDAVREVLA